MKNLWLQTILSACFLSYGLCLVCLDSNGNEVDWYSVFKLPKIESSEDWKLRDGLAHYYLDVHSPTWTFSHTAMNESGNSVGNTLEQIYSETPSSMYVMYNDEKANGAPANSGGHTKGVVAFTNTSGFWLVHSTPKFPNPVKEGYKWTNEDYGQAFLCVSFGYGELKKIVNQLITNQPNIYDYHIPEYMSEALPSLKDLIEGTPPAKPYYSVLDLTSQRGQIFKSFAKGNKFGADLYDGLVAPTLKQDLLVETWLRPEGKELDSNCTAKYKVMKVEAITLPNNISFKETKDHAKWAVTDDKALRELRFKSEQWASWSAVENRWACVGDINRMVSQFKRGGGTLCIPNADVWKAYRSMVTDYQHC